MKLTPMQGPGVASSSPANPLTTPTYQEAKARAVAMLTNNPNAPAAPQTLPQQPEQPIVQNQNKVSAEEMRAVQKPTIDTNTSETTEQSETDVLVSVPQQVAPKQNPALSRKFADLARQEKAIRAKAQQQEQSLKAKEAALAAREAALEAKNQEYTNTKYISAERLKSDPVGTLAEAGVSYDEYVQQIMNPVPKDPRLDPIVSGLKSEIEALKQQLKTTQEQSEQRDQASYEAAKKQIRNDVITLVTKDPEFETIKATRSYQDVVDLIEETYNKDKVLLTVEDAAREVEEYLVEEALKFAKINKIKQKLQQPVVAQNKQAAKPQTTAVDSKQAPQMRTLTNAAASSRQLSARDRAILAFKGELKQ